MVVSRSNYKPMTSKVNGKIVEKYNNNSSISDPITVICNSSDDDGNVSSLNGKSTVITISDDGKNTNKEKNINDERNTNSEGIVNDEVNTIEFLSDRPKRNIERTNYNQSKMMKKLYKQNTPKNTSISNLIKSKRQSREQLRLSKTAEKTLKKQAKLEAAESKPPVDAINIENLLNGLSSSKKTQIVSKLSIIKRSKIVQEDSNDTKFAKISNRAFRYPWEWQASQKSVNPSQILGFRTLSDGLCETLMCRK